MLTLTAVESAADDVRVKILGPDGKPAAGAAVRLAGTSVQTYAGEDGVAVIEAPVASVLNISLFNRYMLEREVSGPEMLVELGEADQLMTLGYDRQISSRYSSRYCWSASL